MSSPVTSQPSPPNHTHYVQTVSDSRTRASAAAYSVLWFLGGLSSFIAFTDLRNKLFSPDDGRAPAYMVFTFLLATVLHQGFIYLDIHQMEAAPKKYEADFTGWFGSRTEVLLRTLIFLSVLFVAGTFLPGLEIVEHYYHGQAYQNQITRILIVGLSGAQFSLVAGSLVLFSLNVLWSAFAHFRRSVRPQSGARHALARFLDDKLTVYALCDTLALLFWLAIVCALAGWWRHTPDVAKAIAFVYIIVLIVRGADLFVIVFKNLAQLVRRSWTHIVTVTKTVTKQEKQNVD